MSYGHKLYVYKDDFDFFDDPLPENALLFAFGDQLNRARELLKDRSRGQINYIIESLDWMLQKGDETLFTKTMEEVETEGQAFINRVKALKSYAKEIFDITEQESLPNATWTDYFATLSLVTILEALHPSNFSEPFTDYAYPMEAMEAVCIAEFYKETKDIKRNDSRESGRKGAKIRTQLFDALKVQVLTFYRDTPRYQNPNLSNKQAAKLLMKEDELKDEINKVLVRGEEQARETLAKWIGRYKRGEYKTLIR